jgi:hypothetical protein
LELITEMSGEVGCWFGLEGCLVGVSRFKVTESELRIKSSMIVPRWSVVGECQRDE